MDEINKAYNEYYEYTNDFIRSAYNITQQDKKEIQQLNKEKKELNKEIDELNNRGQHEFLPCQSQHEPTARQR